MKIEMKWEDEPPVKIDTGARDVTCREVYCGIGIETESGYFGIAERDGVIEIMYNGNIILDSDMMKAAIKGNICKKRNEYSKGL